MAFDESKPVEPDIIKADRKSLSAIDDMPGYDPKNPKYTLALLKAAEETLKGAEAEDAKKEAAFKAARDIMVAAQWGFHNAMLEGKQQVVAQYGDDSNEAQAVGLKKKSERRRPGRKSKKSP